MGLHSGGLVSLKCLNVYLELGDSSFLYPRQWLASLDNLRLPYGIEDVLFSVRATLSNDGWVYRNNPVSFAESGNIQLLLLNGRTYPLMKRLGFKVNVDVTHSCTTNTQMAQYSFEQKMHSLVRIPDVQKDKFLCFYSLHRLRR